MRRLREKFPDELVVVGVHSAKFPSEHLTENIRQAVLRHDIRHPVVNDTGFEIWRQFGVRAWPTLVLIDPAGNHAGAHSGEIDADEFAPAIRALIDAHEADAGPLDRAPLDLRPEAALEPARPLRFPARVSPGPDGRLYVADTGHHRIVELQLNEDGFAAEVLRVFGSGAAGLRDGPAAEAEFHSPHGMALVEGKGGASPLLYVADTDNHAIRAIDLDTGSVRTVAGTGAKAHGRLRLGRPAETPLRSPWALAPVGEGLLLIAMAGTHQIWALINEEQIGPFAGNGREALVDGPRAEASFNQPSDLAVGLGHLFVADAEASAVRAVSLDEDPQVLTLVGQGLFEFGDRDGRGAEVRLQHPTGIAFAARHVYVADSYNHKIKRLDPATGQVQTLIGADAAGQADGPLAEAQLFQPEGLAFGRQPGERGDAPGERGDAPGEHTGSPLLYIADTNNHLIRVADLDAGVLRTLAVRGLARLRPAAARPAELVRLPAVTVRPGRVTLTLEIELPTGYKLNPDAPVTIRVDGGAPRAFAPGDPPALDLEVDEARDVNLDLTLYYCEAADARLCLVHDRRLVAPFKPAAGGAAAAALSYLVDAGGP